MRTRQARTIFASPVLIGAVTVLVLIIAVFLAYNANRGLPFVPTSQLTVRVPNANKLVVGNEVREGGFRVGVVERIVPVRGRERAEASVTLKLDKAVGALPADSTIVIRSRSALGLRYVDLVRGDSADTLPDGATIVADEAAIPADLEAFFNVFDEPTRLNVRRNLDEYGSAFASRGEELNRTFAALPRLLAGLRPVMATLADPDTGLERFFGELGDFFRVTAPVSEEFARGFTAMADSFEALSRDPAALRRTIELSPVVMREGVDSFRVQRPFLRRLAGVSGELRGVAAELRTSVPEINVALRTGTPVLRRTPPLNRALGGALVRLGELAERPSTDAALRGLTATMTTLRPQLRYLGPYVTVCNYWNYWWTLLSDHLTDQNQTGGIQRVQVKTTGEQDDNPSSFGAPEPANGEGYVPGASGSNSPVRLHAQYYPRAVNEQGRADCESGQRGYPRRLATGAPPGFDIVTDPRTPGDQGPTFTGRPGVPEGQTFTADPQLETPGVGR